MTKTYDPKQVVVTFLGVPLQGFADGTFITITPSAERFTKAVGADGEVARGKSNDNTSEVTLTLIQTSESNTYLSSVQLADRTTNAGAGPLSIADLQGQSLFFTESAWIRQEPDVEYAKEVGERAWVFDTGQSASNVVGGIPAV